MSEAQRLLLKLALRAAERGDPEGAAEALRGVLAMSSETRPEGAGELRAVRRSEFAAMVRCTPEHVAHLIKRGEIPPEAVLGTGRGQRIIVAAAVAALQQRKPAKTAESIEEEGAAYVKRRAGLRVVKGVQ